MEDEPAKRPSSNLQGPDDDGHVWVCSREGRHVWCQNLGPVDKVRVVLAEFLASIEQDEGSR